MKHNFIQITLKNEILIKHKINFKYFFLFALLFLVQSLELRAQGILKSINEQSTISQRNTTCVYQFSFSRMIKLSIYRF